MSVYEGKVCPVCGKNKWDSGVCVECKWLDSPFQEEYPDEDGLENFYSLNHSRIYYKHFGTTWVTSEQLKGFDINKYDTRTEKDGLFDWGDSEE